VTTREEEDIDGESLIHQVSSARVTTLSSSPSPPSEPLSLAVAPSGEGGTTTEGEEGVVARVKKALLGKLEDDYYSDGKNMEVQHKHHGQQQSRTFKCETVRSENDHNNTNFKNERPSMRAANEGRQMASLLTFSSPSSSSTSIHQPSAMIKGKDCVSKKRRHSIQFWRKNSLREVKKLAVSLFRSNITARQIKQQVLQKQYQQKVTYLVELIRSISDANPTEQRMKKQYISTLFDGLARRHNNSNVGILLKQRLADG